MPLAVPSDGHSISAPVLMWMREGPSSVLSTWVGGVAVTTNGIAYVSGFAAGTYAQSRSRVDSTLCAVALLSVFSLL